MRKVFKFIGMIFKGIWKVINFIRLAIFNLFFFFVLAMIYFGYQQSQKLPSAPAIQEASALVLNLSGPIVEQRRYINPMDSLTGSLFGQDMPKESVLFDIVETIRHAAKDDNISGLVLSLREMPETNLTKLRYIAKAINQFKASGKPVYAIGEFYSQSQYYLASYADKIYLSPIGAVMLRGYGSYPLYYKTLLEKLDINTHVFRVGTYKSAIEPFIRDNMSEEAKQSASAWLSQLWGAYVSDVASNRQINHNAINPSMAEFLEKLQATNGDLAKFAVDNGLVDALATRQQIRAELADAFGKEGKDSYKAISYYDYQLTQNSNYDSDADDIAVVVASGTIIDGKQPRGSVGGDTVAALLRQARNDDDIKAVVLRVDSPGGSVFASEVIRNEVAAIKATGKPIVVSMSSVAASGGYWISMNADRIIAQPTTLTGSIGIFSVITTFEKSLNELGVYSDGVGTTPFSGVGITRGISEQAGQAIQLGIENGYQRFISLVSDSRNLAIEKVDAVAQGRVWTGFDAMSAGLVDQMGDFDDAISAAAELANMEEYNLYWVEEPLSTTEQFLQELTDNIRITTGIDITQHLPEALVPLSKQVIADSELLSTLNDPKGFYSVCLTCSVE
ncbi:signal peptide peptidase SppA [Vibrio sp. 99-8-1]|uniref:signal peptide peptidase SppA n=1 Tax=Vibrio sp. 99-8-1 TaxID=2607602 RepID=UPI001493712D|nr:signal peptide peptidase SppA [Vibrio sp. 99-8-1]NOI66345.1 signal peptide peptidase SppA [Vibrio sp. 99-8-1]